MNKKKGFWVQLDADVLNYDVMPAVDYRMEDSLNLSELSKVLRVLISSQYAVGMSISIFNPKLDVDGPIARNCIKYRFRTTKLTRHIPRIID